MSKNSVQIQIAKQLPITLNSKISIDDHSVVIHEAVMCGGVTTIHGYLDSIKPVHLRDYQKGVNKEAEWNGEGLPPVGVKAIFSWADFELPQWLKFGQEVEIICHQVNNSVPVAVFRVETVCGMEIYFSGAESFTKPESPEEKEKRERLEAAYDLYESAQHEMGCIGYDSFELFKSNKVQVKFWLAIVDKTNYRKGV